MSVTHFHAARLYNAECALEALRAEGRAMVWQNEANMRRGGEPAFVAKDFHELADRIRACVLDTGAFS